MKVVAYIMLFYFTLGALLPKSDFSQLLKVNDLLEHYALHQQEAEAVGEVCVFTEFLYLHFVSNDDHQHDQQDEHEQLPLQSLSSSILLCLIDVAVTAHCLVPHNTASLPAYQAALQPLALTDIFRPPIYSL